MRPSITVVGLGPAGPDLLPDATRRHLAGAGAAFLRTRRHPAAAELGDVGSFDHHYEEAGSFEEVYDRIVADLVTTAQVLATDGRSVVYAVPGSPLVAEHTVELLRADSRVDLTVVPALSFLDLAWSRLGVDPLAAGVRLVDGTRFAAHAAGERGPLLVAQCWSTDVLSEMKLAVEDLDVAHPDSATVLYHLGLDDEVVVKVPWHELDQAVMPDHLTSVWVPALAAPVAAELVALDELARRLRRDCPWDREQTHASLGRYLLEETYEVLDAIDALDRHQASAEVGGAGAEAAAIAHFEEELGDLLFQVYFHSVLAAEEGRFSLADVARGVREKLIARHPHVFGDVEAADAGQVVQNWEELKKLEKGRRSVTDGIPAALPALALAAKLQRKAAAVPAMAMPSADEDRAAAIAALGALSTPGGTGRGSANDDAAMTAGTALWAATDLVRQLGLEPEEVLRRAALRFGDHLRAAEGASQR